MAIGDAINQPIPAVGTAGTTYATQLVDFLNEVKARLIAKVPLSSLLIGTLDMANNGLQNVAYLGLYNQDDQPASPVGSLAVYQNNLWFVSTAGAFSLTNGASLNASAVKGFTGDYGSPNPAEARFTDLDKTFYFYDDYAGGAWAYTRQRYAELANAATGSVRLRLAFTGPDSYTLTFPTAVPGARTVVQMDANGDLVLSNTFNTVHTINYGPYSGLARTSGGVFSLTDNMGASGIWNIPVDIREGSTITSWKVNVDKATSGANTITARLHKVNAATGSSTALGAAQTSTATGDVTLTETGVTYTSAANETFFIQYENSAWSGGGNEIPRGAQVVYTEP